MSMHTAYRASRSASDGNQSILVACDILGAGQALEHDTQLIETEVDRFNQAADSSVTQHLLSSLQARSRVKELIAANRHKDEFLAMVCHELRNPIASMQNAVSILRKHGGEDATLLLRIHALIDRQLGNMRQLAEGLLDVSQITRGHVRLKCERLDLCEVVRAAVETLQPDFDERCHRLVMTLPEFPIWLQADANRLEQVFVNLLGNGSKYMNAGGELTVAVHVDDSHAIVRVRDAGIGIAREMLPHVFELFVQAEDVMTGSEPGLGIGLALVRMLVELHGGEVSALSAGVGKGSEFTVRLPQRD
jgi:signal transduction histidine kinase